jgi:hypothetical protein
MVHNSSTAAITFGSTGGLGDEFFAEVQEWLATQRSDSVETTPGVLGFGHTPEIVTGLGSAGIGSTGQASINFTVAADVAVGEHVIVGTWVGSAGSPQSAGTVTDSKGNTYQLDDQITNSGLHSVALFSCKVTTPLVNGVDTITLTPTATAIIRLAAVKVSGLLSSGWFDTSAKAQADNVDPATAGPTGTLADEGSLVVVATGGQSIAGSTATAVLPTTTATYFSQGASGRNLGLTAGVVGPTTGVIGTVTWAQDQHDHATVVGVYRRAPSFQLSLAAAGTVGSTGISGTLDQPLGVLTLSAAGTVPRTGTGTPTLGVLTLSSTGTVAVNGSGSPSLGTLALAGTGTVPRTGSGTPTLGTLTLSAAGTVAIQGTGSPTLGVLTLSAAGAVGNIPIQGTGSPTLGVLTLSAAGTVPRTGTGTPTLGVLTTSAAGAVAIKGTASPTLGILTAAGVGSAPIQGTGSAILAVLAVAGAGGQPFDPEAPIIVRGRRLGDFLFDPTFDY